MIKITLIFTIFFTICFSQNLFAEEKSSYNKKESYDRKSHRRIPEFKYTIVERKHTFSEDLINIGVMYGISWAVYGLTQPDHIRDHGSWDNYKNNFGNTVFDQDAPFWNWFLHPLVGMEFFLYYRTHGYTRVQSLAMSFISSALFEYTIETYTEPASVQDLYQTPIYGSMLGVVMEHFSLYMVNSGNPIGKVLGYLANPWMIFGFYKGKVRIYPKYDKNSAGLMLRGEF